MYRVSRLLPSLCLGALLALLPASAQLRDENAPYKDAYDALHGDRVVGEWQGTVSGSTVSQGSGRLGGQAVFVRRGYQDRDDFAIILHDQLNRKGLSFSEISIGMIPCGPQRGQTRLVHVLEFKDAAPGSGTFNFQNLLADTGRDDLMVMPIYGPVLDNPATLQTQWTDDTFTLQVSGRLRSAVVPARNGLIDTDSDQEGWLEYLNLDLKFELERTPETEELFASTLCDEAEHFTVVETKPMSGRENVVLDGAEFDIEFSEPLYEGSFDNSTIMMTTRDPDGEYIYVDAEYSLETPTLLRITPRERLRPGTIYDIILASGVGGVVGEDGETLDEDYEFFFSTLVEPENLRLDIYQVSRNAPLVDGKPAAARIYVDWEELEDIHPDYQVKSYPVEVDVRDKRDKLSFPMRKMRAERPDQFDDEDRRLGHDSLNLFGWTPTASDRPNDFIANVLADEYFPEDPELEPETIERDMDYASQSVDQLTVDFFIAEHSEWMNEGPEDAAVHQIIQSAQKERMFANQLLPVARVSMRYRGTYNITDTICSVPGIEWVVCSDGYNNYRDGDHPVSAAESIGDWSGLLNLFHQHISATSSADILVSYHPPSLGGGQAGTPFEQPDGLIVDPGEAYGGAPASPVLNDLLRDDGSSRPLVAMGTAGFRPNGTPAIVTAPLVVHEFGHIFGLPHIPFAQGPAHRKEVCAAGFKQTAASIEGMRITLDGAHGWPKSSETGNAQSTAPLLNLMFPCLWEPRQQYWIDDRQYNWLVERMPSMLRLTRSGHASIPSALREIRQANQTSPGLEPRLWPASYTPPAAPAPPAWIMVSGLADGENSGLLPAIRVPGPRARLADEDGPYEIRIEDAEGRTLARAAAGPDSVAGRRADRWPFAVTLPVSATPSRIIFSLDGKVLAERRASGGLAAPRFTSHPRNAAFRAGDQLEWLPGSQDDALSYTVRFTADGESWSTLAVLLNETAFQPDPATLRPGPAAAFEIIAYDGVNERSARLPVEIDTPLQPLLALPAGGAGSAPVEAAELVFNVPLDPGSLTHVRLLDPSGRDVPAKTVLDPSGTVISVSPQEPHQANTYTAVFGTMLKAADGRLLASETRIPFKALSLASATAASPSSRKVLPPPRPSRPVPAPDEVPSSPAPSGAAGRAQITLSLGQSVTLPAQILSCESNAGTGTVEIRFETEPGTPQKILMKRSVEGLISATLSRSTSAEIHSKGEDGADWFLTLKDGRVSAGGILSGEGMSAGFTANGECPSG
ncbi:hypothetical protein HNE_2474 [Hyphomonas neptunium ATCC 15444]|uniref:SbsA Ig-like domain-containing protein n=1 Tax=Hyphomonas neptunium (strain ATCC 15444) TaxID=228405 RepID=Q0BZC4_HYPNA|nr:MULTISPECIES: Ig-like domain-containing protein [Hyphomonas]ABI76253.1 hypothetical protein HNE_2474 [Hyphomonas neptunium ATCC 15444]